MKAALAAVGLALLMVLAYGAGAWTPGRPLPSGPRVYAYTTASGCRVYKGTWFRSCSRRK